MSDKIHPAPVEFTDAQINDDPILLYFQYEHMPMPLKMVSSAFCTLAGFIVEALPRNPERTVALRKLLEAKDAGVRTSIWSKPAGPGPSVVERLRTEHDELRDKLNKLDDFILGPVFPNLDPEARKLLQRQALAMSTYLAILVSRIALFEKANDGEKGQDFPIPEGEQVIRTVGDGSIETPVSFKG